MMNRTTTSGLAAAILLFVIVAGVPATARDFLSIEANTPAVPVTPRDPGRKLVRLPALEYLLEIYTQCSDGRTAESLSLNVADTRESLKADRIAGDGPTELKLRIPANQIAPLVVEDFCIVPPEEAGNVPDEAAMEVNIPAILSAQTSLLCVGEEDKAMTYVSKTLDVSLVCNRQAEDGEATAE